MSTVLISVEMCACGQPESAPIHSAAHGHRYAPIRGVDQVRDDQQVEKGPRRGHYALAEYRIVQVKAPAAGADWTASVPAQARWRVQALQAQLLTGAVAGNRIPHLVITDGQGNSVYNFPAPNNQIAASTVQYSAGTTIVTTNFDNASVLVLPYPVKLLGNWTIASLTTGLLAGDQWSNINLYVKEWLQF